MYTFCVFLLRIVRRYCEHQCGDSWFNLWQDMIGDARCYETRTVEVVTPPVVTQADRVEAMLETSLRAASLGQLLHTTVAADRPNLFHVEDTCYYLGQQIECFHELLDQLKVERPKTRHVTRVSELYDIYRHGLHKDTEHNHPIY